MDISVKRLSQGDESTLVEIVHHCKMRSISFEYAGRLLANPLNFFVVAEHKQDPVGFVWGYLLERIDRDQHQLFIYEVEVFPDARRKGVGASLMNFVAEYTKEHHLLEAFVLTDLDNSPARGLYQSTGGTQAEGFPSIYIYDGGAPY